MTLAAARARRHIGVPGMDRYVIYECFPLVCPECGHGRRVIAILAEPVSVKAALKHLRLPTEPPAVAPAPGQPPEDANLEQRPEVDPGAPEPILDDEFDQRVSR